jgi:TldD protein
MNRTIAFLTGTGSLFAAITLIALFLPSAARGEKISLLETIESEIQRTMKEMKLPDSPLPYFSSCSLTLLKTVSASAAMGSIVSAKDHKYARLNVSIRVGDYRLDNTNFTPKRSYGGRSEIGASMPVPIDGDPVVIRRAIWWAMDHAYKKAVENLKRKKSMLKNLSIPPVADDFARAPVERYYCKDKPATIPSIQNLKTQVASLSSILKKNLKLRESNVSAVVISSERWYVNSEGTRTYTLRDTAYISTTAMAQSDDGVLVGDNVLLIAKSFDALPPVSEIKKAIRDLGNRVESMREAPLLDDFIGPALFEEQASAELASRILAESFVSQRVPVKEKKDWYTENTKTSLRRKIGRRVMSTSFNVIDDPTVDSFKGTALFGNRAVDLEGVKTEKVQLVKDGILKTLLTNRTPDKRLPKSNGHAFSPSHELSEYTPHNTNLFIEYKDGLAKKELRKRLIRAIKEQGVDYGLIIRRIAPEDIYKNESWFAYYKSYANDDVSINEPMLAFRVFPDGREELVRVGSLQGLELSSYKDVVAAGKNRYVSSGWSGAGLASIITPSILFEEVILQKQESDVYKPPLLTSPVLLSE